MKGKLSGTEIMIRTFQMVSSKKKRSMRIRNGRTRNDDQQRWRSQICFVLLAVSCAVLLAYAWNIVGVGTGRRRWSSMVATSTKTATDNFDHAIVPADGNDEDGGGIIETSDNGGGDENNKNNITDGSH